MRFTTSFAFVTLMAASHGYAIPKGDELQAPAYTKPATRQPNGSTVSVRMDNLFTFTPARNNTNDNMEEKRDMSHEHVSQPWQSNFCDTSTAEQYSQALSTPSERATVADCKSLLGWLQDNPGYFTADHFTGLIYADLVTSGTCAFGFYRTDGYPSSFDLGNQDVIDLVDLALRKYQDADTQMVGAAGQVRCGGGSSISWSLYNVDWKDDGTMIAGAAPPLDAGA
ncbi:hypothetical protein F5X99DRAFT_432557 [Biscogniauxia marginata]|nr:hypothetical protein F5X99DRAFT_432557 [Biscogniauxia marginata]